jgi:hypothetical protein
LSSVSAPVLPNGSHVTAIVILGMHRSGTSSIAGSLIRLGGGAPAHVMEPAPGNERGFWESPPIMALNDEILNVAGSDWTDWRAFDDWRITEPVASELRARAVATLLSEFEQAAFPVIKDPRMCRLAGCWERVFRDIGWSARVLAPLRSPLEVASSLGRRDGLSPGVSCLLGLRHVLDAEGRSRGFLRSFLDWTEFLNDRSATLERVVAQLELDWPLDVGRLDEVDRFVSPELRHFASTADQLAGASETFRFASEVYDTMRLRIDDPQDGAVLHRLDELRDRFDAAAALFDPVTQRLQVELQDAREEVATMRAELDAARDRETQAGVIPKNAISGPRLSWRRLAAAYVARELQQIE